MVNTRRANYESESESEKRKEDIICTNNTLLHLLSNMVERNGALVREVTEIMSEKYGELEQKYGELDENYSTLDSKYNLLLKKYKEKSDIVVTKTENHAIAVMRTKKLEESLHITEHFILFFTLLGIAGAMIFMYYANVWNRISL